MDASRTCVDSEQVTSDLSLEADELGDVPPPVVATCEWKTRSTYLVS